MSLLPFFKWMESLGISHAIQNATWYNPILQVTHLTALALFAGAMLIVDLRLLGQGLTGRPLPQVARDAQPWLIGGFVVLILTGIPQLLALAMKEYYSPFFWFKMEVLLIATIFWHAAMGCQVVVEDYVHEEGARFFWIMLIKFAAFFAAALAAFSVLKIAFAGDAG